MPTDGGGVGRPLVTGAPPSTPRARPDDTESRGRRPEAARRASVAGAALGGDRGAADARGEPRSSAAVLPLSERHHRVHPGRWLPADPVGGLELHGRRVLLLRQPEHDRVRRADAGLLSAGGGAVSAARYGADRRLLQSATGAAGGARWLPGPPAGPAS